MKIERILVGTDFSAFAARAVNAAAAWARRTRAALRIIHVAPPKRQLAGFWRAGTRTATTAYRRAADTLEQLASAVDPARELEISTELLTGKASREIARAASEFDCDLLVVGAHGEHEPGAYHSSLGHTAAKLLAATREPLLLVRRQPTTEPAVVVAAVDLSSVSDAVMAWAGIAAAGGSVHVVHAYEVPFAARLEAYGLAESAIDVYARDEHERRDQALAALIGRVGPTDVTRIVERGDAVRLLFSQLRRLDSTLIVIGKHAPRRTPSTTFGSVCRYVATFSPTDVLVVPPLPLAATT